MEEGDIEMPIKRIPVCPICDNDMEKLKPNNSVSVQIPTETDTPAIDTPLRTPNDKTIYVPTGYVQFYPWHCKNCGFVAFFENYGVEV